jgi:CHASE3 domain sensor protein
MLDEVFGYSSGMESQETESVKRRVPLVAWLPATIVVVLVILLVIGVVMM